MFFLQKKGGVNGGRDGRNEALEGSEVPLRAGTLPVAGGG